MRHTKGHTANRRSHHALKEARFETCAKCGAKHLMHRVCTKCGTYRGRMVIDVMKKTVKAAKKAEAKKGAHAAHEKPEGAAKVEKSKSSKEDKAKAGNKTKKEQVGE